MNHELITNNLPQRGYIALISVLMILAVVTTATIVITYSSIGEGQSALSFFKGEENLSLIEGCAEDALLKARESAVFADPVGTPITFSRPEGTCSVIVNSKTSGTWNMDVTTTATAYARTVKIIFNRTATGITLTSWKEQ